MMTTTVFKQSWKDKPENCTCGQLSEDHYALNSECPVHSVSADDDKIPMSVEPMHVGGVVCTCPFGNDGVGLMDDITCPIHGLAQPVDGPSPIPDDARLFHPVRKYKFQIDQAFNQDAWVLKFIKYEYMLSEDGRQTRDGRSFVFTITEDGQGEWHEYSGYEIVDPARMPTMSGLDVENRKWFIAEQRESWAQMLSSMTEREDFYKFNYLETNGSQVVVNAPTGEQVQEIIDQGRDGHQFDEDGQ